MHWIQGGQDYPFRVNFKDNIKHEERALYGKSYDDATKIRDYIISTQAMSNTKINMTGLVKFLATREKAIHSENVLREIRRYKPPDNRRERLMNFVRGNRALNEYDRREEHRMTQIWLSKLY